MFHDVGLLEGHRSADERFEIDEANAPTQPMDSPTAIRCGCPLSIVR
jgi:hypothetical protein